jgi:hypothetical protein
MPVPIEDGVPALLTGEERNYIEWITATSHRLSAANAIQDYKTRRDSMDRWMKKDQPQIEKLLVCSGLGR